MNRTLAVPCTRVALAAWLLLSGCGEAAPAKSVSFDGASAQRSAPPPPDAGSGAPAGIKVTAELPCKDGTSVTDVTASGARACALAGGRVACWGDLRGILPSVDQPQSPPRWVGGPPDVRNVIASDAYLLGIDGAGVLWAWDAKTEPVKVTDGAADVAAASNSVCILMKDGEARCFAETWSPRDLLRQPGSTTRDVVELRLSGSQWCARKRGGAVECRWWLSGWKTEPAPSMEPLSDASGLFVEYEDACVLRTSAEPRCSSEYIAPNMFFGRTPRFATTGWPDARWGHCLVDGGGEIVCALSSGGGERVVALGGRAPDQLVMGKDFACARCGETVSCWGDASTMWLGVDVSFRAPKLVPDLSDALSLEVASDASCAERRSGEVRCWGPAAGPSGTFEGSEGDLPEDIARQRKESRAASAGPSFTDNNATCTLAKGVVSCEGENDIGQLGRPISPNRVRHASAPVPGLGVVHELAGAGGHFCALMKDSVACWGKGVSPPLELSFEEPRGLVVNVVGDVCVVSKKGTLHCAHVGPHYSMLQHELLGTDGKQLKEIAGLEGVKLARLGTTHGCALHTDGRVSCFGSPVGNRVGDGGTFVAEPLVIAMPAP